MTVDELFGSPGFPIICILVLIEAMHIIYDEYVKVIDIRTIAVTDKWVREAFDTVAIRLTTVDYNGRHERTSVEKGAYRTQFIIDKNMKLQSILTICVSPDEHFNDEMITYIRNKYAKIHKNDMILLISEFLKYQNVSGSIPRD